MMLIGLSGYAGSGKDAAAQALMADGWVRDAFADRMRTAIYAVNPIVAIEMRQHRLNTTTDIVAYRLAELVDELGWDGAKRSSAEIRSLLQRFGTEGGRHVYGEDFWVDLVLDPIRIGGDGMRFVITDVRFPNEADAIRAIGGIVVRIDRPGVGPNTAPDGTVHQSDIALDDYDFDYRIDNRGTLEELRLTMNLVARDYTHEELAA